MQQMLLWKDNVNMRWSLQEDLPSTLSRGIWFCSDKQLLKSAHNNEVIWCHTGSH